MCQYPPVLRGLGFLYSGHQLEKSTGFNAVKGRIPVGRFPIPVTEQFAFRTEPYEFETEIPALDLLTGSAEARQAIADGASPEEVVELVAPVPASWTQVVKEAEAGLAPATAG